jgi:hypothetical protein
MSHFSLDLTYRDHVRLYVTAVYVGFRARVCVLAATTAGTMLPSELTRPVPVEQGSATKCAPPIPTQRPKVGALLHSDRTHCWCCQTAPACRPAPSREGKHH